MAEDLTKRIDVFRVSSDTTAETECGGPRAKTATETDEWNSVATAHNTPESQIQLLNELCTSPSKCAEESHKILLSHLKTKQSGYRSQDVLKSIYDPDKFIKPEQIMRLLIDSDLKCYYCKKWTPIFYKYVRDSRQWTLERLSNSEGHNYDNVAIACLQCNMRRRTMYHERYLATKQLRVNKIDHPEKNDVEKNTSSVKEDK